MDFVKNFFGQSGTQLPLSAPSANAFEQENNNNNTFSPSFSIGAMLMNWGLFFNKSAFSFPNPTTLKSRIQKNLIFFYSNYIFIFGCFLIYAFFSNFSLIFASILGFGVYYFLFLARPSNEALEVKGIEITDHLKKIIMITAIILLFYFFGTSSLFWVFGIFGTVVLIHSLFYDSSVHSPDLP